LTTVAPSDSAAAYRPEIDGLRALAVLPVVFYHAGFAPFSGGFVGVDVFFVISGYLITAILLREITAGNFSLGKFYERRARRLFPALFAVIAACCVAGYAVLMPGELEDLGESVATTALFTSNFLFFSEAGYFAGPAELKPLLHTWSLAIEEQYYLLFPGFLLLITRYAQSRYLLWVSGLWLMSFAASVAWVALEPDGAFYLLPSRTWELMTGSLLAIGNWRIRRPLINEVGALLGLALIFISVFGYSGATGFPGAAALAPCIGTALVILCAQGGQTTLAGRLLCRRPIVFVGLISYSLYLWHWPVLVYAKHVLVRPLQPVEAGVLVLLAVLLAVASWRFIEQPFRGRSGWLNRRQIFRASIIAMAAAVSVGLIFDQSEGLPQRLPESVLQLARVAEERPAQRGRCEGVIPDQQHSDALCRVNDLDVPPSFILWGDSHAMMSMQALGRAAAQAGRNGLLAASNGCAPIPDVFRPARGRTDCRAFNQATLEFIKQQPQLQSVILMARWARYAEATPFAYESGGTIFLADKDGIAVDVAANRQLFSRSLQSTVAALASLDRRVVILGAVPEMREQIPIQLAKARWRGADVAQQLPYSAFSRRQQYVDQTMAVLGENDAVRYLPLAPQLCSPTACDVMSADGMPLYFDDNHLSSAGLQRVSPVFDEIFSNPPDSHTAPN